MDEALEDVVIARRLRWLDHVARMQEVRIPKRLLIGWLTHQRPMYECKLRWRDRVRKDFKRCKIDEGRWYRGVKERGLWRGQCRGSNTCTKERLAALTIDRHDTSSNTTTTPFVCDMPKIVQEKAGHCKAQVSDDSLQRSDSNCLV